jgi:hypothetical protein
VGWPPPRRSRTTSLSSMRAGVPLAVRRSPHRWPKRSAEGSRTLGARSSEIQKHMYRRLHTYTRMPASMSKVLRSLLKVALPALAVGGLVACGSGASANKEAAHGESSQGASSEVIAQVGAAPITRAQVSHWMTTFARNDYSAVSQIAAPKTAVPEGVVSDPPNYARCVAALEGAAAKSPSGGAKETGVQLLSKCRQLYQALRTQATTYLVNLQRTIGLGRDRGVTPTDGEVQRLFKQFKAREFPTDAAFQRYLASSQRSVADIMVAMRIDVINNGVIKQLKTLQGRVEYNEAEQRWTAKTSCQAGYVVEHCKQYKGGATYPSTPPPSVLMEQVAALTSGRCVNLEACGKQVGK